MLRETALKIAIAQFDARLGDLDSICARISEQARLAIAQNVKVLCVPAPLFCGVDPGTLIENNNFENDLFRHLLDLAQSFSGDGLIFLIPVIEAIDGAPLFDVVMLKEGRVIPTRLFCMHHRSGADQNLWAPPIFEIGGLRLAVSFDAVRDLPSLPQGCDLFIYFQANSFNQDDLSTVGAPGVIDGPLLDSVRDRGIWFAGVCPIGGYDESVFTGGSYFVDDSGRLINFAPSFEDSLLIQDVVRGTLLPEAPAADEFRFCKEEWVWNALQIHLRDHLHACGAPRVVLELDGGLASSLLAVLAVDSIGSRNVVALLMERNDAATPDLIDREMMRRKLVRDLASSLHIQLAVRSTEALADVFDRDARPTDGVRMGDLAASVILADLGDEHEALVLSPLTKTDYSLPASHVDRYRYAAIAPFGDVYITDLEFLARYRNRISCVLPSSIVSLNEVETSMSRILYNAILGCLDDTVMLSRAAELLRGLEASQVDDVFRNAVDLDRAFDDIPLSRSKGDAVSLLLLMMRAGEGARRRMASYPIVSSKSYVERSWPVQLAWSDIGRGGRDPISADGFVRDEIRRFEAKGEQFGQRMREEIAGLIGGMLGMSPDQLRAMLESGKADMRADLERLDEAARDSIDYSGNKEPGDPENGHFDRALPHGVRPSDLPFFSIN